MPRRNPDLHGNVPDKSPVALLLIDVINDLEFEGAASLLAFALPMAERLWELKRLAKAAGVSVIFANDNFGRWQSNFTAQVEHCLGDGVRGEPIARLLRPDEVDYFVLKPKHSAFFSTTLELLLSYLRVESLILTGLAGNICVLFSANDAYLRDYRLHVPRDCVASNTAEENDAALEQMRTVLKADIRPSSEIDFAALGARRQS